MTSTTKYHSSWSRRGRFSTASLVSCVRTRVSLPLQVQERGCLTRHIHGKNDFAVCDVQPAWRFEQLQLPGGLQLGVLLGRGLLGRPHGLPHSVGVAVVGIDSEVLEQHLVHIRRYTR